MVIKNTSANKKLVMQLKRVVNKCFPGYTGYTDYTWNCGKDIRFEIDTCAHFPFTLATDLDADGHLQIAARLHQGMLDAPAAMLLRHSLEDLEGLTQMLSAMVDKAHPQL